MKLIYYFEGPSSLVKFTEYEDPSDIYDKVKNGNKTIQTTEGEQKNLNQN